MKKIFSSLILISLLTAFIGPAMVLAATGPLNGCMITHGEVVEFNTLCIAGGWVSSTTTDIWGMVFKKI